MIVVCCSLIVVRCLSVVGCWSFVVWLLLDGCGLLVFDYCWLFVARRSLLVARCALLVARCLLLVACCS